MIKVNLLNGIASAPGAAMSGSSNPSGSIDANVQKAAGARFVAILLAVGLVYLYNMTVVQSEQAKLSLIQRATKKLQDETNGYGPPAPIVEKYNAEKGKTEKQLTVMRTLAGNRLREVKALDSLQSLMSGDTWLSHVQIKDGHMEMQGMAKTPQGLTDLIRNLGQSAFFTNLQVKSATQEGSATDATNKFDLECQVGANP